MCFYRRRDISSSLILLADKHQSMYHFLVCFSLRAYLLICLLTSLLLMISILRCELFGVSCFNIDIFPPHTNFVQAAYEKTTESKLFPSANHFLRQIISFGKSFPSANHFLHRPFPFLSD